MEQESKLNSSLHSAELREIDVNDIDRNPENPRSIFRPRELEELQESIRTYGIQVPISVYREGNRFVLIDGERRWRCCLKLNKKIIPALVQEKPGPLENLLMMFNIHALREQWDLLTIAVKLPRIVSLLEKQLGKPPNEQELSEKTGLARAVIRRCKLLMELPQEYKDEILNELKKPKPQQRITEDLFIEMERSLKTVERAMPDLIEDKDAVRRLLIDKYKNGIIKSKVDFRQIAKMARVERVGGNKTVAHRELDKLFTQEKYRIDHAYAKSVAEAYRERDLNTSLISLHRQLSEIDVQELDGEAIRNLQILASQIHELLEGVE